MILIDSSLLIAAFRNRKDRWFERWIADVGDVITCDMVKTEVIVGALSVKDIAMRGRQLEWADAIFADIESRGLDWPLCEKAAELAGQARRNGFNPDLDDAFVAAAALEADARVATLNVRHFKQLGVTAFNPLSEHLPGKASA